MPGRDCVLFVTHRWSASIAAHYARLQREAGTVLDVHLVFQAQRPDAVPAGPDAVVVTTAEIAAAFPKRFNDHANWTIHCAELAWMTAANRALLAGYERVWAVEYDVDFSGNWATFFRAAVGYDGDLLGIDLRHRDSDPTWPNTDGYIQPGNVPADPLLGFFPIVRASRGLIDSYVSNVEKDGWTGHFEMVLPSFALAKGFSVGEIGGDTSYTPSERRGLHYTTVATAGRPAATFQFRPPRSFRYFGEAPQAFREPDRLYHPVKTDLTLSERWQFTRQKLGHRWVAFRNRLLRRT